MKKAAAIYSILIGISMIGMWIMFYLTDSIPELKTEPWSISMHLVAEFATALMLIFSGAGLLKNKDWGLKIYLIATGMLLYTLIVSPGYFLQKGEPGFVIMFGVFFVLAIYFLVRLLTKVSRFL